MTLARIISSIDELVASPAAGHTLSRGANGYVSTPHEFHVGAYGAVGDGVTDDKTAIAAAITAASTKGGTVVLPPRSCAFSGQLLVPGGVNIRGSGHSRTSGAEGSRLLCLNAAAQVAFGSTASSHYGGESGNFIVDGNSLATDPFYVGIEVGRTFRDIYVVRAAAGGAALKLAGTQNCQFTNIKVETCAGDGLVFDLGAATNKFNSLGIADIAGWSVKFVASGAAPSGLVAYPLVNFIDGFIIEHHAGLGLGLIYHGAGWMNAFSNGTFALVTGVVSARSLVTMRVDNVAYPTTLVLDNCFYSGHQTYITGVDMTSGTVLTVSGEQTLAALLRFFYAADGAVIHSTGHYSVSAVTTFFVSPTATAFAESTIHRQRNQATVEVKMPTAGDPALITHIGGSPLYTLFANGTMLWSADTTFYRSSANLLKTDDTFQAADGIAHKTKAGTPSDADFQTAPPIGTEVLDTTTRRIWMRTAAATWKDVPLNLGVGADVGNAAKSIQVGVDEETQVWNTAITADRAVTLSTTGAINGAHFHIVRTANATGAFNLNVGTGPLKALAVSTWCDVKYNGSAWYLDAYGGL